MHVQSIQPSLANHSKDVKLLQKQLACGIERNAMVRKSGSQLLSLVDNQRHRLVPRRTLKFPISADQRVLKTVRVVDSRPAK